MRAIYEYKTFYFYILPFKDFNLFKLGVSSGESYARIKFHINNLKKYNIKVDSKESKLVFSSEKEVSQLEDVIKEKFSKYNMAEQVKSSIGVFDGYTEIFSKNCLIQVLNMIDVWYKKSCSGFSISDGLSLKGIFTDNNIDQTDWKNEKKLFPKPELAFLLNQLQIVLKSSQIFRVNFGYTKKVSYFGLHYLIEAEDGFSEDTFNDQYKVQDIFKYGELNVDHSFFSGQQLRSGATYLRGEVILRESVSENGNDSNAEDISCLNLLFESFSNHPLLDQHFMVKSAFSIRNKYVAKFDSYSKGQEVWIGKSLSYPESCLW